jgi:hypothetical protein
MLAAYKRRTGGAAALAAAFIFSSAALQAAPLHDGLISYWSLNEGAGAVANDTAPGGSVVDNGTLRESPTWIAGQFGAGLQFGGTQDVLIPNSTDMDINTGGVTVSAWVKLDKLPSEILGSFAGVYDSAPDNYVLYLDKGNNELRFKATTASGTSTSGLHPGIPAAMLDTTSWHHVMGVYDGSSGAVKLYHNGSLADIATIATATNMNVRTGQVASIGGQPAAADPFAPSNFYEGGISDVAVWNRALGDAEAQYVYNSGAGNAVGAANPSIAANVPVATEPVAQPVIHYALNGNLNNRGTGGAALNGVFHDVAGGTGEIYSPTSIGQGLDLSSNPAPTLSTDGDGLDTGKYVSVDYQLAEQGTIALHFSSQTSFNFQTLWANSAHENAWESWIYGNERVAARGNNAASANNLDQSMTLLGGIDETHHYAFTWQRNGTTMEGALYVDGVLREVSSETWLAPGSTFFMGGGPGNHLGQGIYDDLRIYDVRLSESEILFLAQVPEPASVAVVGLLILGGGIRRCRRGGCA